MAGLCFNVHLNDSKDVLQSIVSSQCKDCLNFQDSKCKKGKLNRIAIDEACPEFEKTIITKKSREKELT